MLKYEINFEKEGELKIIAPIIVWLKIIEFLEQDIGISTFADEFKGIIGSISDQYIDFLKNKEKGEMK